MLYIPIWLYSNTLVTRKNMIIVQLYIPIWLYSNTRIARLIRRLYPLYIPIWLYSNHTVHHIITAEDNPLHSNLVIFKFYHRHNILTWYFLYIPIWLYSNRYKIILFIASWHLYIPIWLYSNPILENWGANSYSLYIPIWLYSNKAIFNKGVNILNFTFQSGYIQIFLSIVNFFVDKPLHSNLVIFKYYLVEGNEALKILYIPIWLYSNWHERRFCWTSTTLYIPIWLYSNSFK